MAATNADGSGLYQCPFYNEWTDSEEDQVVECGYCSEEYKAVSLNRNRKSTKVITLAFPGPKPI
jgi:hypothetical protein